MFHRLLLAVFLPSFFSPFVYSQKLKKADKQLYTNLEAHIHFLADDKLEGRRAGSAGEKTAATYISTELQKAGIQPGMGSGWTQPFDISEGRQVNAASYFLVNGHALVLDKEYFPLAFSALATVQGDPVIAIQESGVPWFIDLKELLDTNQNNPHFDLATALQEKAKECADKGATAVILFNSSASDDHLAFNAKDKTEPVSIPVLYLTKEAAGTYLKDESATMEVKIRVDIGEKKRTGMNVVGYLDNGAAGTVVIGAHYDHLGYGEDGNSLYRGAEKRIHHGADDNASGTAALIELARMLKSSKFKNNNYAFIAFSGEELGLFGSKYFVEHPTIDLKKVDYMINMDMVGRLNDSSRALMVGGYGTSPEWGALFNSSASGKYFHLKYDSSGTGPSDHTSFYRKDIPVLFFFTGFHPDYHKPTDEYDKINYAGEVQVVKYVYSLVEQLDAKGKLTFTKTRETPTTASARFSVTLGIMPDYTFSGSGVRVDAVSDGRPAFKAGMAIGDVIVQLGDYKVSSLDDYMQALSKFKKGESTQVKFKRGAEVTEKEVIF